MFPRSKFLRVSFVVLGILAAAFAFVFWSWSFTTSRLNAERLMGIFPSPSERMLTLVRSEYAGIQEARIVHAKQEIFPLGGGHHIWYVIACIWADSRADGSPIGSPTHDFDAPGDYFVDTHEGWLMMPENSWPIL